MSLIDVLMARFAKRKNKADQKLSSDFEAQVSRAILLIGNNTDIDINTDKAFVKFLIDNNIPPADATEIMLFLPIAFIRKLVPKLKWPDTYIEFISDKKQIERKYSETKSFEIIWRVTSAYFETPNKETVFKLAARSAEFNAMNHLLLANPELEIEELNMSKTVILR